MSIESILIWILLGAVAGWLAGQIMKGSSLGTVENIVIGIIGSFVGGWLGGALGIAGTQTGGFSLASLVTATVGAIVLLFVIQLVKKKM
ncbi:MAG: GlsB/YeaQ/YmgE family stress response membrane protein [Aureispira sp.]|nr:GlsB/YeaQ/YmgE family stress response membrane protein [Aureispira sp.]